MAIKLKLKIGPKLLINYFILLLITFILTLSLFQFFSQRYLINQTREQLKLEANLIVTSLKEVSLTDSKLRDLVITKRKIEVSNRQISASIAVLNNQKKLIYTNMEAENSRELLRTINQLTNNKDFVSVKLPIFNNNRGIKGYIILFSKIRDIKKMNNLMLGTQIISFLIAIFVALLIGYVMERNLTKPLRKLTDFTNRFSLKDNKKIEIRTADEISELADSFNLMISRLRKYDEQQKIFLQNASHELKTPLMAIQGNAEAIKDRIVEGKEVEVSLDVIIEESQRLKKLVEEIVYLTKLENMDDSFNFSKVDIRDILINTIKKLQYLADKKGIIIELDNNISLLGNFDSEKLSRALINIISNCIRYATSKILISCKINTDIITIRIIDDGPGLKSGEEGRIFDRFYKGEDGGTGIGLSITKAIIEGHQGKIMVQNNRPSGAVFIIELPVLNPNR